MDRIAVRLLHGFLAWSLTAALLPALHAQERPNPQNSPQTRPTPAARPQPGSRPAPTHRPAGQRPTQTQPPASRPPQARPQPARPQPARPQPSTRPTHTQPVRPQPVNRPPQNQPPAQKPVHGRPPQWGRPPASRPSYNWRPNDRDRLRRYYAARLRAINRANRPRFVVGGYYPYAYIGYLQPVPPDVYGYLPPPPPGYQMGYYDGYVVVYDPVTYFIVNVIDLLQ